MKQIKQKKQQCRAWRTSSSLYLKLFMLLAVFVSSVGSAWADEISLAGTHFHQWYDIYGNDVKDNPSCENRFSSSVDAGATVYGDGNVYYLNYVNVKGGNGAIMPNAQKLVVEGNSNVEVRILYNRQTDEGSLEETIITIGSDGKAEFDISGLSTFHLNAVKIPWNESTGNVVTAIKVVSPTTYTISWAYADWTEGDTQAAVNGGGCDVWYTLGDDETKIKEPRTNVPAGTKVTYHATVNGYYRFNRWARVSDNASFGWGNLNYTYTQSLDADINIIPEFRESRRFVGAVQNGVGGSVKVHTWNSSTNAFNDDNINGNYEFWATKVQFEAVPDPGYLFSGWAEGGSDNPLEYTGAEKSVDHTRTAIFTSSVTYTVTTAMVAEPAGGDLTGCEAYFLINDTGDKKTTASVPSGTKVVFYAADGTKLMFNKWNADAYNKKQEVTVTDNLTYTAQFVPGYYSDFVLSPAAAGRVETYVTGHREYGVVSEGTRRHKSVDQITCEAVANTGYTFVRWSDGNTQNPRNLGQLSADVNLTAIFSYNLNVSKIDEGNMGSAKVTIGGTDYSANPSSTVSITDDTPIAFSASTTNKEKPFWRWHIGKGDHFEYRANFTLTDFSSYVHEDDGSLSVVAEFGGVHFIANTNNSYGSVDVKLNGVSKGTDFLTTPYPVGTLTFVATCDAAHFDGWYDTSNNLVSTSKVYTVTDDSYKNNGVTLTAKFSLITNQTWDFTTAKTSPIYYQGGENTGKTNNNAWPKFDTNDSHGYNIAGYTYAYNAGGSVIYDNIEFNGVIAFNSGNLNFRDNNASIRIPVRRGQRVTFVMNGYFTSSANQAVGLTNADREIVLSKESGNAIIGDNYVVATEDGYLTLTNIKNKQINVNSITLDSNLEHINSFVDCDNGETILASVGVTDYANPIDPELILPNGATVTYSSSNAAYVEVNSSTGVVNIKQTLPAEGITITATISAPGFTPRTISYTLKNGAIHFGEPLIEKEVDANGAAIVWQDVHMGATHTADCEIPETEIRWSIKSYPSYMTKPLITTTEDGSGNAITVFGVPKSGDYVEVEARSGAASATYRISTYGFVFSETAPIYEFPANGTYKQTVSGASGFTMERIGAISKLAGVAIDETTGEITGLPAYGDNKGGAIVVKAKGTQEDATTFIKNPRFDDNIGNWTININNNQASGYMTDTDHGALSKFIEAWHDVTTAPLADGEIYQKIKDLPAGDYILEVDAIAVNQAAEGGSPATNVYLFVQDGIGAWKSTSVGTANGVPQHYTLEFTKKANKTDLTIGLATRAGDGTINANWIAADNFSLTRKKEISYVLTIPYKKYTWDFYNEGDTREVTTAQVLANQTIGTNTGYHLTMGDLVDSKNGHPHAASEVPSSAESYLPNNGTGVYPGQYIVSDGVITDAERTKLVGLITKEWKWKQIQAGEESNVVTNNEAPNYWDYTFKTRNQQDQDPKKPVRYCNEELFSYRDAVNGNNVRIVKDTQGLIFNAGANAFGINDRFVSADVKNAKNEIIETAISGREMDRSILIYKGSSFTVPRVQKGDYVKLHWYRHSDDAGDMFSVTNAEDMDDVAIDPDHILRITGSHYQGQKGSGGVYRGYTIVKARETGPITFTAMANSWMEIYTIEQTKDYDTELRVICGDVTADPTEDGWGGPMKSTTVGRNMDTEVIHIVRDSRNNDTHDRSRLSINEWIDKEKGSTKKSSKGDCATTPSNQFGANPIIYIASYPGATYGWNGWTLDVECAPVPEDATKLSINCQEPLMTRIGDNISYGVHALTDFKGTGTAHVIVRTKNGSVNGSPRYTLDKQEAYFPVGEYIPQTYPYTWDFRQYNINGTKDGSNGIRYNTKANADNDSYGGWNTNMMATWKEVGPTVQADRNINTYNKFLFADGSQLTMNQGNNDGATYIREAEGLRVDLSGDWTKACSWNNNASVTMDGNVLDVKGTITIPEVDKDMYIFVRSANKPTSVTINGVAAEEPESISKSVDYYSDNTTVAINVQHDASNKDIPSNVWVYKQNVDGLQDVVVTPNGAIEAIGVTPYFKPMTIGFKSSDGQQLRSTWATDARPERIDYNNSGLFTNHNIKTYIATSHHITDTETGVGTVKLVEKAVIPSNVESGENRGLLVCDLLTATEYNHADIKNATPQADYTARPLIPLFVPACNIPNDDISGNRLVGIMNTTTKIALPYDDVYNYILTNRYWDEDAAHDATHNSPTDNPTGVSHVNQAIDHISFYLLTNNDGYARPNSAYLNLEGDGGSFSAKQFYIVIGGENGETVLEEIKLDEKEAVKSGIYTLTGRKLDTLPTEKGIYIINGKKVFVK